jgi:hypothetical protein
VPRIVAPTLTHIFAASRSSRSRCVMILWIVTTLSQSNTGGGGGGSGSQFLSRPRARHSRSRSVHTKTSSPRDIGHTRHSPRASLNIGLITRAGASGPHPLGPWTEMSSARILPTRSRANQLQLSSRTAHMSVFWLAPNESF